MMEGWNDRLNAPGIKPSPPTVGDVVEGQSMLAPTAGRLSFGVKSVAAQRKRGGLRP